MCVLGSIFAIVVVKCLFGGLGCNFANPAVTGRVVLLISFTSALGGGAVPKILGFSTDASVVSGATALEAYGSGSALPSLLDMFLGIRGGAIGESCIAALVIGFAYLVIRRVINPEVPLVFVGTVFFFALAFTGSFSTALFQVLAGGLVFGAVFMATDYVTTPITRSGKIIFAFGCGVITALVRFFGSYPEGVSFAILFMNILSPYIEKWTAKIPLGGKK
jgi:electron transport complex protein RnfD